MLDSRRSWFTRVACVPLLCLSAMAQSGGAGPQDRWLFTAGENTGVMRQAGSTLELTFDDPDGQARWTQVGSIEGHHPGKAGLYVGDLDGTGQTSVAFYDQQQGLWYHGSLSNGQVVFRPVQGDVFHVGDGPLLFPAEGYAAENFSAATEKNGDSLRAAAASAQSQPVFPIRASQYTRLATSRNMNTDLTVYDDGYLSAVTRVHNGVWLAGYHGGVQVTILDENKRPLYSVSSPKIGVTGTFFGKSTVTAGWQKQVPPNVLAEARYVSILQMWDPDFTTFIRDITPWLKFIQDIAQAIATVIPK